MKFRIVKREKGYLDLGLVYGGIGLFGFVGARFLSELTTLLPPCPFHHLTGFPCPTCGLTRSGILLSQFRIWEAFVTNPLFILLCSGIAMWALCALVLHFSGKRVRIEHFDKLKPFIRILLIGTILANWIYLVITRT